MAVTAKRRTQITRNGAHIAAFAAGHFKGDVVFVFAVHHHQLFDPERAGGKFHILAIAGQFIGALAVDFYRRKLGRHLHDVAHKLTQRSFDILVRGAQIGLGDHFAFGIVGVGGLPQTHGEGIGLQRIGDERHGFGGLAKGHGKHAGGIGIKGASVACFLGIKSPADFIDHRGGGHACGLVDHEPARNITSFALTSHDPTLVSLGNAVKAAG